MSFYNQEPHPVKRNLHKPTVLSPMTLIYHAKFGPQNKWTFTLKLGFESFNNCTQARLQTSQQHRMKTDTRSYTWTVSSPEHPQKLQSLLQHILAAAEPNAPVHDPRSKLSQWFNHLIGQRLINTLPTVAEQHQPYLQTLSAKIWENTHGRWVTLTYKRPHHSLQTQHLPIEALQALQAHLTEISHSPKE